MKNHKSLIFSACFSEKVKFWGRLRKPGAICFLIVLLVGGFLVSCETLVNDINPDRLPTTKNQLVIHGYLSPQDTLISISVQVSEPVLGQIPQSGISLISVPGAQVLLTNRGRTIEIPYDTRRQQYVVNTRAMPIRAAETYQLKVTLNGQTAESSCTIPRLVFISEVNRDSALVANQTSSASPLYDLTYRLFWTDTRGERNYYRISGAATQTIRTQTMPNTFMLVPNVLNISFGGFNSIWVTDEGNDGLFMISEEGRIPYSFRIRPNVVAGSRRVEFVLLSYEKTYYDYHQAVQKFDGNNPFAEPSLVPTNIKGGLGCFAGYTRNARVGGW